MRRARGKTPTKHTAPEKLFVSEVGHQNSCDSTTLNTSPLPTVCAGDARDVSMDSTQEASDEDMGGAGVGGASALSPERPSRMDEETVEPEQLSASTIEGMTVGGGLPQPASPCAAFFCLFVYSHTLDSPS